MKSPFFTLLAFLSMTHFATGQEAVETIVPDAGCNYTGEGIPKKISAFGSEREAIETVDKILKPTGLVRRFIIKAADVDNAAAVIQGENRYLLYNPKFIETLQKADPDWAALSVMAHELGHHLNGHTLRAGGSRPETELEADLYSGFICASLGATLEQSQAAMKAVASENGSATHPPKKSRLLAIRYGWSKWHELAKSRKTGSESKVEKPNIETTSEAESTYSITSNSELLSDGWWKWELSISSSKEAELKLVEKVVYELHPSFTPNTVTVTDSHGDNPNFTLVGQGWGGFPVRALVHLSNGKLIERSHQLTLSRK